MNQKNGKFISISTPPSNSNINCAALSIDQIEEYM